MEFSKCLFNLIISLLTISSMFNVIDCSKPESGDKKGQKRSRSSQTSGKCKPHIMAEYELFFHAEWSPVTFPKMYPRYRPTAQWSQLIGRTHSESYTMWSTEELASDAVKMFAEDGDTSGLDMESQNYHGVRDVFTAPPIRSGLGQASTNIVADGRHSKVSLMVKVTPSPDWFVGVSSLDLCDRGRWRKVIDVDIYAMDAGTDDGLTFSSPTWPSFSRVKPFKLSPINPNHPASSFYYPEIDGLPRMGRLELRKAAEFRRKGKKLPVVEGTENVIIYNEEGEVISLESSDDASREEILLSQRNSADTNELSAYGENTSQEDESIVPCLVSVWTDWSVCSKTCGFGQQERRRRIIRRASDARQNCPVLRELRTCGTMKTCEWESFKFLKRSG